MRPPSSFVALVASGLISAGANGVYAKPATSVTQEQETRTCAVLGQLSGLEEYEINAFAVRCAGTSIDTRPEVTTDPTVADFFVATDSRLAATAYRLLGLYKLGKDLGASKRVLSQQATWYATLRRDCKSKGCLQVAYQRRLDSLTAALQEASDPLPVHWSGDHEAAGCPDDRTDSFRLTYQVDGQGLQGKIVGSVYCTNKVFDTDFRGRISGHLAFINYEAGWSDEHQPAEAVIASRSGHVYWELLSPIEVEDYVWDSADTTGH